MDVIIILGALVGKDGHPGRVARFRLQHALPLVIEDYPDSWVVITGGLLPGRLMSEAQAMGDWAVRQAQDLWGEAVSQGVARRLIFEEASLDTASSAHHTALLMQTRGFKTAGVVTDTLHMPRVQYLFRRTFSPQGLEFQPFPAPGLFQDYWRRRRYLRLSKFILREAGAWVKLWGKGVIRG